MSNDVILTFLKLLAKVKKPRLIDFLAGLCVCLRSVRVTADVGGATERLTLLPCASKFATVPSCTRRPATDRVLRMVMRNSQRQR